jgi:hypothetical protein
MKGTRYLFIAAAAAVFLSCSLTDDDEDALKWRSAVDVPINAVLRMEAYSQFVVPPSPGAFNSNIPGASDIYNAPGELDVGELLDYLGLASEDELDVGRLSEYFDLIDTSDSRMQDMLFEYFGYKDTDTLILDLFSDTFAASEMIRDLAAGIEDLSAEYKITVDNKYDFGAVFYVLFAPGGEEGVVAGLDVNEVYEIVTAAGTRQQDYLDQNYVSLLGPGGLRIAGGRKVTPPSNAKLCEYLLNVFIDYPDLYWRWLAKVSIGDLKKIAKLSGDDPAKFVDARLKLRLSGISKI